VCPRAASFFAAARILPLEDRVHPPRTPWTLIFGFQVFNLLLRLIAMKIAVTGSTGLVGEAFIDDAKHHGDEIVRVVRSNPQPGDCLWNVKDETIDAAALEGVDAVVHLAGENIAEGSWNEAKRKRIVESRSNGTQLIAKTIAKLQNPPQVLISASATGYYGSRADEVLTEESAPGEGFLVDVCRQWEESAEPARAAGIRVAHPRIGIVLTPKGAALKKMLLPFKMGVGGRVGSGQQWWSWITLPDLINCIRFAIENESITGPFNAVSPQPLTNADFTKVLASVLSRPAFFPVPAFGLRMLLGQMADDLLLASTRVQPVVLENAGYQFVHPDLETALRDLLDRPAKTAHAS